MVLSMGAKGTLSLRPRKGYTTASQKACVTSGVSPCLQLSQDFFLHIMNDESCRLGTMWGLCVDETKMGSMEGS